MAHYELIARHFQHHIEHLSLSVDAMADILEQAADHVAHAIFAEQKLLCCGTGVDATGAMLLGELLRKGLVRERPTLPAVELCARSSEPVDGAINWLGQQITALGQPGDVAIVFASTLGPAELERLGGTLNRRQVKPVWIGAQGPGPSLTFPGANASTTLALSLASTVCLAEIIDIATFGPLEETT